MIIECGKLGRRYEAPDVARSLLHVRERYLDVDWLQIVPAERDVAPDRDRWAGRQHRREIVDHLIVLVATFLGEAGEHIDAPCRQMQPQDVGGVRVERLAWIAGIEAG